MSAIPESLRRILAAQKPAAAPAPLPDSLRRVLAKAPPSERSVTTLVWRDGETWRRNDDGLWRQIRGTDSIP